MRLPRLLPMLAVAVTAVTAAPVSAQAPAGSFIRVNQVGYLPDAPKVAVICSLQPARFRRFEVEDGSGRVAFGPARARAAEPFGPCASTYRLDFSGLRTEGVYRLVAGNVQSPPVRIARDAYAGAADVLLRYMREQRSGFNPFFGVPVHTHTDGILVDHPDAGRYIPVAGGWADASDYLQYVTTSATATFDLLASYRDHPAAFADSVDVDGLPGANGVPDVLDEARHGLEWLVKMYPEDDLMLNQLGDDRDHAFLDLPPTDTSDYGWGRGRYRAVYPCTGKPQGLFGNENRSDGYASTAGKFASALALGARLFAGRDPAFAAVLGRKARAAYALGRKYPGVCQTAPGTQPYFYEEASWVDDMELGAAELHALTGDGSFLSQAVAYAAKEPVTPWMGRDTARHYEFYPWHNRGHYEVWRQGDEAAKRQMADDYREGLERVVARAKNGFRVGIPFIWCSNNLMTSFATQAYLYRTMTGDERFREYEQAALDWLFGTNPWGVSMVVGYPAGGTTAQTPHSVVAHQLGVKSITGGLLDGPVYRSIYHNLKGIQLVDPDEYAPFNTGFIVYHDDFGDYSTNEPIMDGTASLEYLLSALGG
ncbi:MAG TPA: glycoside hydrolase family 9 protein [Longimicrobiaceae bacterium]|nr:glycoside hydrolase family 9 protein [Longimicrobiaceae bacterium]